MRFFQLIALCGLASFILISKSEASSFVVEHYPQAGCEISVDTHNDIQPFLEGYDGFVLTCPVDERIMGEDFDIQNCSRRKFDFIRSNPMTRPSFPTVAVNGRYITSGNYNKIIESGIELAHAQNELNKIQIENQDNQLTAKLPKVDKQQMYDLWIFAYQKEKSSVFEPLPDLLHSHDEQGNHTELSEEDKKAMEPVEVNFQNVVKSIKLLGDWDGREESIVIPLHDFQSEGFAIAAQEKQGGPIVAFGFLD